MLQEFLPAAPVLIVLLGATLGVIFEAAVPRQLRPVVQLCWSLLVLLASFGTTIVNSTSMDSQLTLINALALDGPAQMSWMLILVFGALAVLLFAERRAGGGESPFAPSAAAVPSSQAERQAIAAGQEQTEVFPLLLFSIGGMMVFVSASDLLTMFIALEVLSFPLYILSGMARRRRLLSQEASLKYFLLGGLSSAVFLYGVALVFGYAGSFRFRDIDLAIQLNTQSQWLLLAGLAMISIGVLFKMGAVPFHNWVPDVYQGAPTPVTAFMAICTKLAATVGLMRLLYVPLGALRWDWQPVLAVVALLTMVVGSLVGLFQSDVKRLLAYSSIAHAGFILIGVLAAVTTVNGLPQGELGSVSSLLIYLAAYGLPTMAAFAIVTLVRRSGAEATGFDSWAGLGRRSPMLGFAMTVFLLSMAGIPLTGGFIGKLIVFSAGWTAGYSWLVFVAIIASLVTAGFYFRLILIIFAREPRDEVVVVLPGIGTQIVIWVGVVGTILLGVLSGPLLDMAINLAGFIR